MQPLIDLPGFQRSPLPVCCACRSISGLSPHLGDAEAPRPTERPAGRDLPHAPYLAGAHDRHDPSTKRLSGIPPSLAVHSRNHRRMQ